MLYQPLPEHVIVIMVILPIYLLFVAVLGGIVGCGFWFAGFLVERKVGVLTRAVVGIVVPILTSLLLNLAVGSDLKWRALLTPFVPVLMVILPAALMAGSRFNPMRSLLLGLEPAPPLHDFGRAFSFFPALLLRLASTVGLSEAVIYLANLPPSNVRDWHLRGDGFPEAILAVCYFGITAIVSFGLPRKQFVVIGALLSNALIIRWASNSPLLPGFATEYFPRVIPIFVGCWCLFVLGRLLAADTPRPRVFRILPVTMLEVRIRHALNHW